MKKHIFLIHITLIHFVSNAQTLDWIVSEKYIEFKQGKIYGTLIDPVKNKDASIVLIIAGSGPTDRDGNNQMMKNNSIKYLAEEISKKGIATIRYDKRGIGKSTLKNIIEDSVRFDNMVDDARLWIDSIIALKKYKKITILGHSEGSLVGMMAAQKVKNFISLSGTGYSADIILKQQIKKNSPQVFDMCEPLIDSLKNGYKLTNVNPMLYILFRPSVQPYMISWLKINPQDEIKKLTIPILIIQGDSDIQVGVENAEALKNANPKSQKTIISKMNHVLKEVNSDKENKDAYNDPNLPVSIPMVDEILGFILGCYIKFNN
jgi:uncharacterized protein